MKHILLLFITSSLSFAQSLYANMTIYKDGFALIKQPVLWEELESDQNIIIWDILPTGIVQGSPFLNLDNANVLIQSFNQDVFRFSDRLYNYLGTKVEVKLINENDMNGPKGSKELTINDKIFTATVSENNILSLKQNTKKENLKTIWGTTRSIINSALIGVSVGHEKILELSGVEIGRASCRERV